MKKLILFLMLFSFLFSFAACGDAELDTLGSELIKEVISDYVESLGENDPEESSGDLSGIAEVIQEDGSYSSLEEVYAYLLEYGRLPSNYIKKKDTEKLGWVSKEGNLWKVAPGKSIGGDHFGNYEGALPEADGRKYTECDIDFEGEYRGAKRLIFSNDGLYFYTDDHYETFTELGGR